MAQQEASAKSADPEATGTNNNTEAVMVTRPTKQQVQSYLQQRRESNLPPPAPAEIRRQLGWGLMQSVRDTGR